MVGKKIFFLLFFRRNSTQCRVILQFWCRLSLLHRVFHGTLFFVAQLCEFIRIQRIITKKSIVQAFVELVDALLPILDCEFCAIKMHSSPTLLSSWSQHSSCSHKSINENMEQINLDIVLGNGPSVSIYFRKLLQDIIVER